ncbi:hypothetical protein NPIL_697841 [Nephila pilipes]|uniref:Uncharacterized protein n=1 Tax=Nephila pilipes TaxID=299642 RepID=A0A8X6MKI4_NEPPI|nr:hypothetical protein NPIL_697841 [Nephila pilipes]
MDLILFPKHIPVFVDYYFQKQTRIPWFYFPRVRWESHRVLKMETEPDHSNNETEQHTTGESLHNFPYSLGLGALLNEISNDKFASENFKTCMIIDEKINVLPGIQFPYPKSKQDLIHSLVQMQEEAQLKFKSA